MDSKIYVMNIDGIEPAPRLGRLGPLAAELQWTADGSGLYFTAQNEGSQNLYFLPLAGTAPTGAADDRARTC